MTAENRQRNVLRPSSEGEQVKNPPPINWYIGIGTVGKGIMRVTYTSSLTDKEDGEIGKQLSEWIHYTGNYPKRGTKQRVARAQQSIAHAEEFIQDHLGYSPQELQTRRQELEEEYRGKQSAPFAVEFY